MEKVCIFPHKLQGEVHVPSSKSMGHREIICAGLANGRSIVDNISMSKDIEATIRCLRAMGVVVVEIASRFPERKALMITGTGKLYAKEAGADCGESGSTLRFFIPLAATLGEPFTLEGHGKLVSRPLQAYYDIFAEQQLAYSNNEGELPLTVNGVLKAGTYKLPGNVSSQYVSGLLFSLPLLEGDSVIEITSPLESASYVDMTLSCLKKYGIVIDNVGGAHREYRIKGRQKYRALDSVVEADWSQAAFWLVGGSVGEAINCTGVDFSSLQGDKAIVEIMERMGARLERTEHTVKACHAATTKTVIDATNCPDIIPILTVLAATSAGTTEIINAGRLRIKECDRLAAITTELNKMGADIEELPEGLVIHGKPEGLAGDALVEAWNDHRIAMSVAIAASACREPVVLEGTESVQKSYPNFWKDFVAVGGRIEAIG